MFAGANILRLEAIEVVGADSAPLGEQPLEHGGPCAEGLGHFQQHRVAGEGVRECRSKGHAIVTRPDPGAVPGILSQHRRAAGREFIDGAAVAPAECLVPYLSGNAHKDIVVRRRSRSLSGLHAMLVFSGVLALVPPCAIRDVIERRLLGPGARPAFGQMRPDIGVHDRAIALILRAPLRNGEGRWRSIDVDIEPFPMAGGSGIDGLPRRPVVSQQVGPVHGQPLGRGDGQRITVIETDIVVPVPDLIVTECYLAPFVRSRR